MKALNLVVWGLGRHAIKNILPAIKECPGVQLYGICTRSKEVLAKYSALTGGIYWDNSISMLEDPSVDIVYLSTPIGLHASQGKSVLLANKHLWCEKPLAENLEQALMLVKLSRERGLTLAEGFMYLYHPQFLYLNEILHSEILGKVQNIACRFGIPPLEHPGFRLDPKLGGGAFLDVGSYPMSAMVSFFPDLIPAVLFSELVVSSGFLVDSEGRATLEYENGIRATLEWGIDRAYRNEIDFWGSKGSVFSERVFSKSADYVPKFRFLDLNGVEKHEVGQPADHFLLMFSAFRKLIDCVEDAEKERGSVIQRAQLMEKIKEAAKLKGSKCNTGKTFF